jgi:hypothetical protein
VRPYEVVVLPNDFPLYEPTLFYIKGGPVAWIGCPLAREEARSNTYTVRIDRVIINSDEAVRPDAVRNITLLCEEGIVDALLTFPQ